MASKVFISWSGNLSKRLAEELRTWLPGVLQFVKPFFTPDDVEKGARWSSDISNELSSSNAGIICLTKDNIDKPWILFEAGALSKSFDKANVCTILFNLDNADITGPLTSFQSTRFEKADFKKLLTTINNTGGESKLDAPVLNDVFEMWWPKLNESISSILNTHTPEKSGKHRSDREIIEEILELSRMNLKRNPSQPNPLVSPSKIFDILIEFRDKVLETADLNGTKDIYDHFGNAIDRIFAEYGDMESMGRYFEDYKTLIQNPKVVGHATRIGDLLELTTRAKKNLKNCPPIN